MTLEDRIDRALEHISEQKNCIRDVKRALREHGQMLARIDERTKEHAKRMDRMDKKSAGLGAASGLVGGFLAMIAKTLFGPPGS